MTRSAQVFEILIASPSDVQEERDLIRDAIHEWNILHSRQKACVLLPVMWETHATPALGDRPQAIINRQVVDTCDALIGTFWTRLGSPTGDSLSGTVEELERIHASGRPVMLYFSTRPTSLADVDLDQLSALRSFRAECMNRGLVEEYASPHELGRKLALGLSRLAEELSQSAADSTSSQVPPAKQDARAKQASDLKQMLKRWELNTKLRVQGHDDCKALMGRYFQWYLGNLGPLTAMSPNWEVLADLANQLTKYRFVMGPESSSRFYEIGQGVLTTSVSLMETGNVAPALDEIGKSVLLFIAHNKSKGDREELPSITASVGSSADVVESTVTELERLGLVKSRLYIGGKKDFALSGTGHVRAAIEHKNGLTHA